MRRAPEVPEFAWPARFTYSYRWRFLGWLLEAHAVLREALVRALPRSVHRVLHLTERIAEIPFVIQALRPAPGSRILDIGARWSPLPLFLSAMGLRVVAADLSPFQVQGSGPDFVLADMRRPPFRPGVFDGATIVSTLEHVGLGYYDPRPDSEDDIRMMNLVRSLVRGGGRVILTVPFGVPEMDDHQRVYDRSRLGRVTVGWMVEAERFAIRDGIAWREATEREAAAVHSVPETQAVAMLALRKAG